MEPSQEKTPNPQGPRELKMWFGLVRKKGEVGQQRPANREVAENKKHLERTIGRFKLMPS